MAGAANPWHGSAMTANRHLIVFAAANGAMAVMLGAFAAHEAGPAVKTLLTTGAHYQMVHAVLAVACALWMRRRAAGADRRLAGVGGRAGVLAGAVDDRPDEPAGHGHGGAGGRGADDRGLGVLLFAALRGDG